MKKTLFFLFFVLPSFSLTYSQGGWSWAKSYMGSEEVFATPSTMTNRIFHSEFDSQGNTYILGTYGQGASFNDTDLLGLAFGGATTSILVMKLDPDGNTVWKRSIKNSSASSFFPNWMKLVGDTSLVINTVISLASSERALWYLDTLVAPGYYDPLPNYPFPFYENGANVSGVGNAFITFDLNGLVTSQHFLEVAYLDSLGESIEGAGSYSFVENGKVSPFHIDNSGNIYICTQLNKISPPQSNYTSESFRLIIDGERTIDFGMNYRGNAKIFKFSPNFNELIWSRDLMVDTTRTGSPPVQYDEFTPFITGIASDSIGNIFISGHIYHFVPNYPYADSLHSITIFIDSSNRDLTIDIEPGAQNVGFIIKYDTSGNALWENQLHGYTQFAGNENHGLVVGFGSQFHNLTINEDNNSVYVIAQMHAGESRDVNTYLRFNDTIEYKTRTEKMSFIRYNKDNGEYLSHGIANSEGNDGTGSRIAYGFGTIPFVAKNNQVFAQVLYWNNIIGFNTVIEALNTGYNGSGLALVRWREDGGLIDVIDFPTNSLRNRIIAGGVTMNDSGDIVLFGCADNEISFGPFTVGQGTAGKSRAFIAKYSDPSFVQDYEGEVYFYVPDTIPDTLNLIGDINTIDEILVSPNPTKDEVYITTKEEQINSYSLYNINGQLLLKSEKVKTNSQKLNLSAFTKGVYVLKVVTDKNVYSRKVIKN